jgi:hypothetical protein
MTTEETDTPDTGTDDTPGETPDQPDEPDKGDEEPDWKAQAEKYKALARKHEGRAKANSKAVKELEDLKASQLSEQEKAVKAAREEGYTEGRSKGDQRLIRAEVIAAAAGKAADPGDVYALLSANGVLAGIEVNDDGEVDSETITNAVATLLAEKKHLVALPQPRDPDFGRKTPEAGTGKSMNDLIKQKLRNR